MPCGALIGPDSTQNTHRLLSLISLCVFHKFPFLLFSPNSLLLSWFWVFCFRFLLCLISENEICMAENIPMPSSADPAGPPDCFASEPTWTDSDSSAITLDVSKDAWLHCDHAMQGKSTEWTNEKHSMYLDYLEASFVDELYHSMYLGGLGMKKNSWRPYYSDQCVVHGDGGRKKIGYERNELLFDSTADSHVVMESQSIHHLEYSGTGYPVECLNSQEHVLRENEIHSKGKLTGLYESASLEKKPVGHKCHQDLVWSAAEFSDQNFVEDNHGGKLSRKYPSKRLKTAAKDGSSNDQITILEKFHARGVSIGNNMSCTRKRT